MSPHVFGWDDALKNHYRKPTLCSTLDEIDPTLKSHRSTNTVHIQLRRKRALYSKHVKFAKDRQTQNVCGDDVSPRNYLLDDNFQHSNGVACIGIIVGVDVFLDIRPSIEGKPTRSIGKTAV